MNGDDLLSAVDRDTVLPAQKGSSIPMSASDTDLNADRHPLELRMGRAQSTLPSALPSAAVYAEFALQQLGSFSSIRSASTSATHPHWGPAPPPDDPLSASDLGALMVSARPKLAGPRFSMSDITGDPKMATAARRELDDTQCALVRSSQGGHGSSGGSAGDLSLGFGGNVNLCYVGVHDVEIERQQAASEAINASVLEEGKINKEMADLLVERLDGGLRSLESLVGLIKALSAAELAYTAAMGSAARQHRPNSEVDDRAFQTAVHRLSGLPSVIARTHGVLHASLVSTGAGLQKLLDSYHAACREVAARSAQAYRHVDQRRVRLRQTFCEHTAVCRAFDVVLLERAQGRPARGPEKDPWASEGRLVQDHKALQQHQDVERDVLRQAFRRATLLEEERAALMKAALTETGEAYSAALLPLQHDLAAMTAALRDVDTDRRLTELHRAARCASDTATALTAHQAQSIQGVCQELFCSPEIVRQGGMAVWQGSELQWLRCHFVLTRAGYLHWFKSMDDTLPLDVLNLAKCHFEQGKAPCFNIVEARSGGWLAAGKQRKCTLQAAGIEDCCEWCIAIREAIAVACGKQLSYEGE